MMVQVDAYTLVGSVQLHPRWCFWTLAYSNNYTDSLHFAIMIYLGILHKMLLESITEMRRKCCVSQTIC
jgi:hypothetical protein